MPFTVASFFRKHWKRGLRLSRNVREAAVKAANAAYDEAKTNNWSEARCMRYAIGAARRAAKITKPDKVSREQYYEEQQADKREASQE